jgi:hypothetical protein
VFYAVGSAVDKLHRFSSKRLFIGEILTHTL